MTVFAERVRMLREEADLSQEELAEILEVRGNTISRWELGSNLPGKEKLEELARYFKVSTLYLLGETDDRMPVMSEEEEEKRAKQDENQMLKLYRMLSSDMQKMIRVMVSQAYIVDKDRGTLRQ